MRFHYETESIATLWCDLAWLLFCKYFRIHCKVIWTILYQCSLITKWTYYFCFPWSYKWVNFIRPYCKCRAHLWLQGQPTWNSMFNAVVNGKWLTISTNWLDLFAQLADQLGSENSQKCSANVFISRTIVMLEPNYKQPILTSTPFNASINHLWVTSIRLWNFQNVMRILWQLATAC